MGERDVHPAPDLSAGISGCASAAKVWDENVPPQHQHRWISVYVTLSGRQPQRPTHSSRYPCAPKKSAESRSPNVGKSWSRRALLPSGRERTRRICTTSETMCIAEHGRLSSLVIMIVSWSPAIPAHIHHEITRWNLSSQTCVAFLQCPPSIPRVLLYWRQFFISDLSVSICHILATKCFVFEFNWRQLLRQHNAQLLLSGWVSNRFCGRCAGRFRRNMECLVRGASA